MSCITESRGPSYDKLQSRMSRYSRKSCKAATPSWYALCCGWRWAWSREQGACLTGRGALGACCTCRQVRRDTTSARPYPCNLCLHAGRAPSVSRHHPLHIVHYPHLQPGSPRTAKPHHPAHAGFHQHAQHKTPLVPFRMRADGRARPTTWPGPSHRLKRTWGEAAREDAVASLLKAKIKQLGRLECEALRCGKASHSSLSSCLILAFKRAMPRHPRAHPPCSLQPAAGGRAGSSGSLRISTPLQRNAQLTHTTPCIHAGRHQHQQQR